MTRNWSSPNGMSHKDVNNAELYVGYMFVYEKKFNTGFIMWKNSGTLNGQTEQGMNC